MSSLSLGFTYSLPTVYGHLSTTSNSEQPLPINVSCYGSMDYHQMKSSTDHSIMQFSHDNLEIAENDASSVPVLNLEEVQGAKQ